MIVLDQEQATGLAGALLDSGFAVQTVDEKPYKRSPYPPFRTSTLQQEAGRKLRFSSSRTMSVAQRLYENGYITYMRTDSTSLSDSAVGHGAGPDLEALRPGVPVPETAGVRLEGEGRAGGP